jgi:ubiquitin C-terminal hydrolase
MKNNEKGFISNFELTTNIGFNNIGHTCYMNSFLQILLHIPNFLPKLKENFSNNTEKNSLIFNLIKLSEYPSNTKYLYEIKKIMGKIDSKYGEFIQGDTQSFATDFINTIINQIKNENEFSSTSSSRQSEEYNNLTIEDIKKKKFNKFNSDLEKMGEKTFIEDLFNFIGLSIRYKNKLTTDSNISFDLLLNIELIFPYNNENKSFSLYELLDIKYSGSNKNDNTKEFPKIEEMGAKQIKEEIENFCKKYLSGLFYTLFNSCIKKERKESNPEEEANIIKNKDNYETIKNIDNFSKVQLISKIISLPKILIITFVRGIEGKNLISSYVSFYDKLDLSKYIDYDLYDINLGTTYKLYAINLRKGDTKSSGHCFSYVKINGNWFCYNDSYVHKENPNYNLNSVVGLYYIKD